MKNPTIALGLSVLVALVVGLFLTNGMTKKPKTEAPTQLSKKARKNAAPATQSETDLDSLAREVAAEVPRQENSAGHVIIASADTSDAEKTDALLRSFARGEAHLEHMRYENAFVTRRQIVELPETFTEIGERLRNGEAVDKIILPDFDGKTFEMEYDPSLMGPSGEKNGTLIGDITGKEASDAILGYHEDATSAYINIPTDSRVLEYMTVGGNQIVIKEIDHNQRNLTEPCGLCQSADGSSPHAAGAAHHVAHGLNRQGGQNQTSSTTQ